MVNKEYRLEVKVRNNLILTLMEQRGIATLKDLADRSAVTYTVLCHLVSLKLPARKLNGEWRASVISLSDFFSCLPEDLFSQEQQYNALEVNRASAELGYSEIKQLTSASVLEQRPDLLAEARDVKRVINQTLLSLSEREQRVVALRFGLNGQGEHTLEEIAEMFSITRERIRLIEARALRKLKHPMRSRTLREAAGAVDKRSYWRNGISDDSDCFDGEVFEVLGTLG